MPHYKLSLITNQIIYNHQVSKVVFMKNYDLFIFGNDNPTVKVSSKYAILFKYPV